MTMCPLPRDVRDVRKEPIWVVRIGRSSTAFHPNLPRETKRAATTKAPRLQLFVERPARPPCRLSLRSGTVFREAPHARSHCLLHLRQDGRAVHLRTILHHLQG